MGLIAGPAHPWGLGFYFLLLLLLIRGQVAVHFSPDGLGFSGADERLLHGGISHPDDHQISRPFGKLSNRLDASSSERVTTSFILWVWHFLLLFFSSFFLFFLDILGLDEKMAHTGVTDGMEEH